MLFRAIVEDIGNIAKRWDFDEEAFKDLLIVSVAITDIFLKLYLLTIIPPFSVFQPISPGKSHILLQEFRQITLRNIGAS